jgi:hypothetical protein
VSVAETKEVRSGRRKKDRDREDCMVSQDERTRIWSRTCISLQASVLFPSTKIRHIERPTFIQIPAF